MTEEARETEPQCIGCGWPESRCDCHRREVDLCRNELADKIADLLADWWKSAKGWMADGEWDGNVPPYIVELQEEAAHLENATHAALAAENARLESELAALRQVVADVETCRDHGHGVTVYCDDDHVFESTHHSAVILLTDNIRVPFYAPTWQAALHAAAEHVRREA